MPILELEKKFSVYYATDFESEQSDTIANASLRREALELFKQAQDSGDNELAEEIIDLLAENTGCQEDLELFEKFSRLSNDNSKGKRGSGLGLYLCKQIIELHAGRVWAESEPGKWARFCFLIPTGYN